MRYLWITLLGLFALACQPAYPFYDAVSAPVEEITRFRLWDMHYPQSCFVHVQPAPPPASGELVSLRIESQNCQPLGLLFTRVQVSQGFYILDYIEVPGVGQRCFSASATTSAGETRNSPALCVNRSEKLDPEDW